ncbi:MAG: isoleucine--tRNA ligase [Candidatus Levybacteria bacterium]|nr:isoleucine--tRNA ligase [Candidatus Levybacteria bacterium]
MKKDKSVTGFKPVNPKVDFPKLERDLLEKWYKSGIVDKYLKKNSSSKEKFSFLDGPITANNPMGVHHAWGRTYKDFWQRFWNMNGKKQRFQNGFDEQGLWVEVEVEKELALRNKKEIENLIPGDKFKSLEKFINLCKERVKKFSAIQTEQSKRLGYFMDWNNSYHTSSDANNYAIWNFLKVVNEKGWLYKGHDTVPWCPRCGTAISQHEILTEDYRVVNHETVLFKLPVLNEDYSLLVWTTTPWTIPANVSVAVNPKFKYRVWEYKGEKLIIVSPDEIRKKGKSSEYDTEQFQWYEDNIIKAGFEHKGGVDDIDGKDLVGKKYKGPFDSLARVEKAKLENPETFHVIVAAEDLVVGNKGTGLLHLAPAAGEEDFKIAKDKKLSIIEVIDEEANYLNDMGEFSGRNAKKHPEIIVDFLKNKEDGKFLHATPKIEHRYPICWRCKKELVWRVVDEWYIAMDRPSLKASDGKSTFREMMIGVARKITWMPDWGLDRELDWLKNMHDWLISKKRYWGLALPIWECNKCGNFEVIGSKDDLKNKAVEGWKKFEGNSPHRPWVDQVKIKCSKCGEKISRIPDVGNPWLDAGIVPFSTLPNEWFPADFITESFPGQFKNWFYSLIAMSTALKNTNSFERVLGFGSVRDEKGEEMHKSKGNSIEFNEAADKAGVDVMRWLYLRTNPEHNVNFGYGVLDELRRMFVIKLWNVYSFFVTYTNFYKFDPSKMEFESESILDKWILSRMNGSISNITRSVEKYDAMDAMGLIEIFIDDLSNWYVRRSRERVKENSQDAKDTLKTLWTVLTTYSKVLAPFVPFMSDEIFTNLTAEESVHLSDWPKSNSKLIVNELEKQMAWARVISSGILELRKSNNIKVRIPLRELNYNGPVELSKEILQIVLEETNVYKLKYIGKKDEFGLGGDVDEENQDIDAGEARDIVRRIQAERKTLGTTFDEKVNVIIENWPKEFEEDIKKKAMVGSLQKGPKFLVTRK